AEPDRHAGDDEWREQYGAPESARAEGVASERQRGRRPDGQRQQRAGAGDDDAVDGGPPELGLGQCVLVPAERQSGRRERQDGGRVERRDDDHDRRQRHEPDEQPDEDASDHAAAPARASARVTTARRRNVTTSATAAKAALPGQLKASRARSFTTLAIIFTRPPPSSSGVGRALNVHANTTSDPDTTPGIDSGSVTRQKTLRGGAPRLAAARSEVRS